MFTCQCSSLHNWFSFRDNSLAMSRSPHVGRVGFYNEGNSCFLNAAIQVRVLHVVHLVVSPSHPRGAEFLATGEVYPNGSYGFDK